MCLFIAFLKNSIAVIVKKNEKKKKDNHDYPHLDYCPLLCYHNKVSDDMLLELPQVSVNPGNLQKISK